MKKQRIKIAAIIFTLVITIITHPFLYVYALSTNHGHQTFTGGRLEWEINTYDAVQDITVEGTTFRAGGIIILNYYFTNTSVGTLRVNWSGFNVGWYNAMNVYTFGATISAIATTGTTGITLKINNATDRVTVVISFNATDMNTSLQSITSFINTPSLTTSTDQTQSTLSDIDVKLANIDLTLSDLYDLINADNGNIINYLDEIAAYAEYLEDIKLDLDDIDNTIDTITWKSIAITFNGWTSNFSTYDTTENKLYSGGYYEFGNFDIFGDTPRLYRLQIPIKGEPAYTITSFKLYLRSTTNYQFNLTNYLFEVDKNFITYYFYFDTGFLYSNTATKLVVQYQAVGPSSSTRYTYTDYLSLKYIEDSDIEYWTLRNAIAQSQVIEALNNLSTGSTETTTSQNIDSITDELNQSINDSNQAQESINDMMDDFKLNFDLNNYKFTFDDDFINYYKMKLTDLYDIQELRPFYIIPLVLFILWRLLSG